MGYQGLGVRGSWECLEAGTRPGHLLLGRTPQHEKGGAVGLQLQVQVRQGLDIGVGVLTVVRRCTRSRGGWKGKVPRRAAAQSVGR